MKKYGLTLILFTCLINCGLTQTFCSYKIETNTIKFHKEIKSVLISNTRSSYDKLYIPVKVHDLIKDNGTGKTSISKINNAFKIANSVYENLNIKFYQCGDVNYIKNSIIYNDKCLFEAVRDYKVNNVFNWFIVKEMVIVLEDIDYEFDIEGNGGYGSVTIEEKYLDDYRVLNHEIGHVLSLAHTFGSLTELTDELVNGSNCYESGDFICDTPADHFILNKENSCESIAGRVDANGESFDPLDNNFMAYQTCEENLEFTEVQMKSMYYYAKFNLSNYSCPDAISNFHTKLEIYPNPTRDYTTLSFFTPQKSSFKVEIYNLMGKKIKTYISQLSEIGEQEYTIEIPPSISQGVYYVGLNFNNDITFKK
jgi:hypothetical protein